MLPTSLEGSLERFRDRMFGYEEQHCNSICTKIQDTRRRLREKKKKAKRETIEILLKFGKVTLKLSHEFAKE